MIIDHLNLLLTHQFVIHRRVVGEFTLLRVAPIAEDNTGALVLVSVHNLLGQLLPLQILTTSCRSITVVAKVWLV